MSAVPAEVYSNRAVFDKTLDSRHTMSKLSLALDAVSNEKNHAADSVASYLDVLLQVLNGLNVVQMREGAFDARVLSTIDASKEFVDEYRTLMTKIAEVESGAYSPQIIAFLEGVLNVKKNYPIGETAAYLWRDALGFISRELFLATVSPLIKRSRWSCVRTLLQHRYSTGDGEQTSSYCAFDGFQRSLDVFRNRRLQLERVSVSADVLKERVESASADFEDVMQTDFFLHVYSLLAGHGPMHAWRARTLGYASEQIVSGFDVFVSARGGNVAGLEEVFGVANLSQFHGKLEVAVSESNCIASSAIDYAGFSAMNNAIFDH